MVAVLVRDETVGNVCAGEQLVLDVSDSQGIDADSAVAICSTTAIDTARITRLLGFSGVANSNIVVCEPGQLASLSTYALVLCHRVNQPLLSPVLPDLSNVSRTIVISDCTRVETAIGFLDSGARHVFRFHESDSILQARLEAGLRQHRSVSLRSFSEGDIHFDVQRRKVTRAGLHVDLSPKEYEFAHHLFSRLEQVVRNSELMTSVWSLPADMDTRRIDTAACRVRKKLGLSFDNGWELKRVRRVGYRLSRVVSSLGNTGSQLTQTAST